MGNIFGCIEQEENDTYVMDDNNKKAIDVR